MILFLYKYCLTHLAKDEIFSNILSFEEDILEYD